MICDGVMPLHRFPLSMVIETSPWRYGKAPNVMEMIDSLVDGHATRMMPRRSEPHRPSCCCRNANHSRSLMNSNPFIHLLNQFSFCDEGKNKCQCVNIPVDKFKNTSNSLNTNKEESSSKSDKHHKSTTDETENVNRESEVTCEESCNNNAVTNDDSASKNSISESNKEHPWQFIVRVNGCDEVRAFTESGVLNVEGRRQRGHSTMQVRHHTTLPSEVDPSTLTAILTQDGQLIVTQKKDQITDNVTELNIIKESEAGKDSKRDEKEERKTEGKENKQQEQHSDRSLHEEAHGDDSEHSQLKED